MTPPGTTLRNVRIADELYDPIQAKCERLGTTFSDVVRELLAAWLDEPE